MKYLQGPKTRRLGIFHDPKTGRRDYYYTMLVDGVPIAKIYYHPAAAQLVVDAHENVVLTKKTMLHLTVFLDKHLFQNFRRLDVSRIRKYRRQQRELL